MGPNWKYRYRDSREAILERRISSLGVSGRRVESRVKSTSVDIWSRELVWLKMLGAENRGRVEMRKIRAVRKSTKSARETARGTGRMGIPWMEGAARMER